MNDEMQDVFNVAFDHVIANEGGYVNDPLDKGGETNYGITVAVARSYGFDGDMKDLKLKTAKEIYKRGYWDSINLNTVSVSSPAVAIELFDSAVNCGVARATQWLQQACNLLNRDEEMFNDLVVDGVIGPVTLNGLDILIEEGDQDVLLQTLNILQGAHYISITQKNKNFERFIRGWIKRTK